MNAIKKIIIKLIRLFVIATMAVAAIELDLDRMRKDDIFDLLVTGRFVVVGLVATVTRCAPLNPSASTHGGHLPLGRGRVTFNPVLHY